MSFKNRKILIINANPSPDSFCLELAKRYYNGAMKAGTDVELINLIDLKFDLILRDGYRGKQILENDLIEVQNKIQNANHLVFIFPNWWGTYSALLKGFIDRVFIPDFAFNYIKGSLLWEKLLKGKTARLIITMDTPTWYYLLFYKKPGINSFKKSILNFCGINPVKTTIFSPIKKSSEKQRLKWLKYTENLGKKEG